jgi:hypothetical protein
MTQIRARGKIAHWAMQASSFSIASHIALQRHL